MCSGGGDGARGDGPEESQVGYWEPFVLPKSSEVLGRCGVTWRCPGCGTEEHGLERPHRGSMAGLDGVGGLPQLHDAAILPPLLRAVWEAVQVFVCILFQSQPLFQLVGCVALRRLPRALFFNKLLQKPAS